MYIKRKTISIVAAGVLSFLLLSLAPVFSNKVFAATKTLGPSNGKLQLAVSLTGIADSSSVSKYTVTATQTVSQSPTKTNDYAFAYITSGSYKGTYLSQGILYIDNGCTRALSNDALAIYQINITAEYGNSSGSTTVDTCGYSSSFVYPVSLAVKNNAQVGGIKGTFTWISNDGTAKPYPASTTVNLTGPSGTNYVVTLNDGGTIVGPSQVFKDLPVGSYSIKVDYNPTNPADGVQLREYPKSFTVTSGNVTDITGTAPLKIPSDPTIGESAANIQCQASITNPLTWLVCPMIAAANKAVNVFDGQISCLLQVDLNDVFGTAANNSLNNPYAAACNPSGDTSVNGKSTSDAYYAAWNTFRSFALALMVIAGLVMVISQAAGFEFLDAYTVRKILPRLLIAGVGITLSWEIMQFLVQITNAVGYGIRDIIYFPFKDFGATTISGFTSSTVGSATILGGLAFLGLAGLGTLALTALLGVLVAFITLVLRKLIIIFLLMLAPLALACYILPNTQKFWKMWWDTLSKTLLVFPIIGAMIAVGHVFAATSYGSGGGGATSQIIAFIAYFLPYFLIPTAVKMAGGAVGAVAGMVNNRAQGGFGMLRKQRAGITERRRHNAVERAKEGNVFRTAPEGTRRDLINKGVKRTTKLGQAGLNPLTMRSKLRTAMNDSAETGVAKVFESEEAKAIFGNDSTVWAARFGTRESIMAELEKQDPAYFGGNSGRIAREDAAAQILRTQSKFGNEEFQRARLQAQAKTGTGYVREGKFNAAMVIKDINDTYGSDRNGANRALARVRGSLGESGQVAGVAGFGTWSKQLEDSYRNPANLANAHSIIMDDAIDSASPSQAIYGKKSSAATMGAQWATRIKAIANERIKPENQNQQAQVILDAQLSVAMSSAAGIYDAMSQASPQNASAMANELMGVTLDNGPGIIGGSSGQQFTIREYIQSQMDSNPEFVNRRRDMTQSTYDQAQRERAMGQGMPTNGSTGDGMPGGQMPKI